MKDNGIIYFHGYNSSPATDKVTMLKEHFEEVYAFPIDPDPDVSIPYLENEIERVYTETINKPSELVFVGTSLGAWFAGFMAMKWFSPAVLINPCYSFLAEKIDLGMPQELKVKYDDFGFFYPPRTKFFIDPKDAVLDMKPLIETIESDERLYWKPEYVPGGTHRFNGKAFEKVIEFIETKDFQAP